MTTRYEPTPDPREIVAANGYTLYRHLRSGASGAASPTTGRTLELMSAVLKARDFGYPMPPPDLKALAALSTEHDWEGQYQREQAGDELGPEDRDLREHLAWLRGQLDSFKGAVERHTQLWEEHQAIPSLDDAKTIEKTWATYGSALEKFEALDGRLRRRIEAHRSYVERSRRVDEIYAGLLTRYGGKGPQYEIACRSLAIVTADIEAARKPAAQGGVEGLKTLVVLQQALINQLQKFTESTKVDVAEDKRVREVAEAVAACAIRRLVNAQPDLADIIVDDMRRELIARGYGDPGNGQPLTPPVPALAAPGPNGGSA